MTFATKLNLLLLEAKQSGRTTVKRELMQILFLGASEVNQRQNLRNLLNGKTRAIRIDHVYTICEFLHCDANELFDIKPKL